MVAVFLSSVVYVVTPVTSWKEYDIIEIAQVGRYGFYKRSIVLGKLNNQGKLNTRQLQYERETGFNSPAGEGVEVGEF